MRTNYTLIRANYFEEAVDQEIGWGWGVGMDWIDLALGKDKWRALVNKVLNFWVPQNARNFSAS